MQQRTCREMISGFWRAKKRHIEDSGNGEMILVACILMKLKKFSGWTKRSCQILKAGVMAKRQAVASKEKGHPRMEKLTEAIISSSHIRIFAKQMNMVKNNRGNEKWKGKYIF